MGAGGRETCTAQPESEGVCMGGGAIMRKRGVDQMSMYIEDNGGQVSNSWKLE